MVSGAPAVATLVLADGKQLIASDSLVEMSTTVATFLDGKLKHPPARIFAGFALKCQRTLSSVLRLRGMYQHEEGAPFPHSFAEAFSLFSVFHLAAGGGALLDTGTNQLPVCSVGCEHTHTHSSAHASTVCVALGSAASYSMCGKLQACGHVAAVAG
jgi:hypothetical protein